MTAAGRDLQYVKFCAYGFLRNLRFFEAFLIVFLLDRGMGYTQIGILYAVREISANVLEIPSGIAADVLGRRRTLAASFLAYILSFLIFYLFSALPAYGLAFILYGTGEAFRSGTHKGMIADYLKSRGEKSSMASYYGHTRSWSQLGLALSSLIAGVIVFFSGSFGGIFLFSAIPYIINFFLILSYPSFLDDNSRAGQTGKRQRIREVLKQSFRTISDRKVFNLLNQTALHTAYLKAMKDYIQPVLLSMVIFLPLPDRFNQDQKAALFIGAVYFLIYILTSRASARAGRLASSSLRNIPMATLAAGLSAGALGGLLHILDLAPLTILLFICVHLIENVRKPVMTGFVSDKVDSAILTSVLSVQSQLKTVFTALIALLFGVAADYKGVGWSLFLVSSLLLFFSLFVDRSGGERLE